MNAVDLVIIGLVAVLGLIGLRTGLLKPISGIGGLIIGVIVAMQHSAEVALMLADYIEGDLPRRVAAFGGIVIASAAVARLVAWIVKKILSTLMLGWFDHVAGALGGAALGLVLAGTGTYLLTGADLDPTRDALAASKLAPEVTRATVLSSTQPWCSQVEGGVVGTDCTDLEGLLNDYFGERISQQVTSLLGEDAGALAEVVQSTLSGESTEGLSGILESDAVSGLFSDDSGVLADTLGGVLEGKSPEEIANLVSATGAGGLLEGKSAEEIASLVSSGDLPEIPQETIDALIQGSAAAEAAPQTETQ